ncbi:hypothetical protein FRC00_001181, partial [Tulasnella sp. 408]
MSKSYAGPPRSPHDPTLPSFSLIGALEFRSVVDALEKESTAAALSMFNTATSPYAAGHYHRHRTASEHSRHSPRSSRRNSRTTTREEEEVDPWDAALAQGQHTDSPVDHPGQRVPLATLHTGSPTRSPADSIFVASPRSPMDGSGLLTTPNAVEIPVVKSAPAIVDRAEDTQTALVASSETLDIKPPSRARLVMSE